MVNKCRRFACVGLRFYQAKDRGSSVRAVHHVSVLSSFRRAGKLADFAVATETGDGIVGCCAPSVIAAGAGAQAPATSAVSGSSMLRPPSEPACASSEATASFLRVCIS